MDTLIIMTWIEYGYIHLSLVNILPKMLAPNVGKHTTSCLLGDDWHSFECPRDEETCGSHERDRAAMELSSWPTHHEALGQSGRYFTGLKQANFQFGSDKNALEHASANTFVSNVF